MNGVRPLALAAVCGWGVVLFAAAQDPQKPVPTPVQDPQRPIFRAGVDVVRVDVYPRRRDRVVEGLKATDFQLTEDGVRQTIETFEYIEIDMDRGLEPLDPRNASEAQRMAADPRNRVFVFYLDTYAITMEGSARAREPLLHFLQGSMGPRDLFAWMEPKHSPEFLEFTRMTQDLATLMTVARPWGKKDVPTDDPFEQRLETCGPGGGRGPGGLVGSWRGHEVMRDLRELIIRLGALRQERKSLVILGERFQNNSSPFMRRREPASDTGFEDPASSRSIPLFAQASLPVTQGGRGSFVPPSNPSADHAAFCQAIRRYIASDVVFDERNTMVDLARRNNVALYFVSLAPANLFNFSPARWFAEDTDGRNMVSNDIAASLDAVLDHQTGFYMLGYRSTAGESGRKARTVRVKTTKSGVDLDVRRIYEPPQPEFIAARNLPPPPIVRTDVEKAIDQLPPLREDATLAMTAVRRTGTVEVSVEIVPRLAAAEPWSTGGQVHIVVRDAADAILARADGPFRGGERSVRVSVPLAFTDVSRVARASAVVVHANGATLGDSVVVDTADSSVIGAPNFYRAGSLPRLPYLPAALLSFARDERIRVEWPLAGVVGAPAVRLMNVAGKELPSDIVVRIHEGTPAILRADIRVLSLAPGEYVIEAAGWSGGTPVKHLTAIRVTR
jgi:VWFA-related protein